MVDRHFGRRIRASAITLVFILGGASVLLKSQGLSSVSVAVAADVSQAEFEQRVRTYLLEHPEVIGEALARLDAKQAERDAADAKAALKAHASEVFQDPDSPGAGNPNGDVTLVEFFDYNCPYCRAMAPLMSKAAEADPKLRIVYKEFPILGAGSVFAAKAALAANKQGKYEAFHRALYEVRGAVDEGKVLEVAKSVGVDVDRMKADMQDKAIETEIDRNGKLGEVLHITGTPGFVIGDQIATGAMQLDAMQSLISKAEQGDQVKE